MRSFRVAVLALAVLLGVAEVVGFVLTVAAATHYEE